MRNVFRFVWVSTAVTIVMLPLAYCTNSYRLQSGDYGVALVSFYGQPAMSRTTGTRYALMSTNWYKDEYNLFESSRTFGLVWKKVPGIALGYSFNGFHRGHDVLISRDSKRLFTRRNTALNYGSHVVLSDVIDISVSPPKVLVQGPMCCMDGEDTEEGVERNHQRILPIARAAGVVVNE